MLEVTIVVPEDLVSSTAVVPLEIFHSAGRLWNVLQGHTAEPAFHVRTVTLDGGPVGSAHGLSTTPHGALADVARTDIVIVSAPSFDLDLAHVADSPLPQWLRRRHEHGALVVGVQTGAAFLAEAGLLDGRIAATHWALRDRFAARYPRVRWAPDRVISDVQGVLCAGGGFACVDVSLYLVEKFCGREIALQCARSLLLPMPRQPHAGYAVQIVSQAHGDERIGGVEAFLQANYQRDDLSAPLLARQAGLSERTFARRFKAATGKTPFGYLQAFRIQTAKVMLERENKPIQAISSEVGYDSVEFFRSLFKRTTGMTPSRYRARFAPLALRLQATLHAPSVRRDGVWGMPSRSFEPKQVATEGLGAMGVPRRQ